MEDFTTNLVKKYNVRPKYIKKLKYMYICTTDRGVRLLRPVNYDISKIVFVHNIKTHLLQKGFDKMDFYYISEDGLPYVLNGNTPYVMTDYINYRECDLSEHSEIRSSIMNIANFHKLSQGFVHHNVNTTPLDVLEFFRKKLNNLTRMKRQLSKQKNLLDLEVSFIKNYEFYYREAFSSIEIIEKFNHTKLSNIAIKNNMICHNSLKEDNILFNNKDVYLTNFENITIDHFIYDLANFILRYIIKQGENCISIEEILYTYSKINYVDKNILPILYAILKFPTRYIDCCQSFFDTRRNFTPVGISTQIETILGLKEFHSNFINKIKPISFET